MYQNKMLFILVVACWLCSMIVYGVSVPTGPLQSHLIGAFMRSSKSDLDCNQFDSDYDVLYHFPFQIMVNPISSNGKKSTAVMNGNGTLVVELQLRNQNTVPLSIFCLKNLLHLEIHNMLFSDGNSC